MVQPLLDEALGKAYQMQAMYSQCKAIICEEEGLRSLDTDLGRG